MYIITIRFIESIQLHAGNARLLDLSQFLRSCFVAILNNGIANYISMELKRVLKESCRSRETKFEIE